MKNYGMEPFSDNDPLTGLANLFDLLLVFIVGLLLMVLTALNMQDVFSEKSNFTIMKQNSAGHLEIITKQGKHIKASRVTDVQAEGRGMRLGTAYKLEDGSMVYVPED
jgi:hypothetical protein